MVATYSREEILELDDEDIVLNKPNSMCSLERFELDKISKKGDEIIFTGEGKTISSNLRSIKYLNDKSDRQTHTNPFDEHEFKRFLSANKAELIPRYRFQITVIKEASSNIGFSITFNELIPATEEVFYQFWHIHQHLNIPHVNIPFKLGKIRINKENNRAVIVDSNLIKSDILINLGVFNGRRSIEVKNFYNETEIRSAKHEEMAIRNLCENIRRILETP